MNESWKDQRITELEQENAELKKENAELRRENQALKARVADLEAQLADVLEKLALLQKMHFGRSSEKSKASTNTQKKTKKNVKR